MTHHKLTLGRRDVLKAGGAVAALACAGQGIASTTPFQWERGGPASGRLAPDFAARLAQGVESGEFANLHAVFVARAGRVEAECYFEGQDERWGTSLGRVAFTADTLHDVRSGSPTS